MITRNEVLDFISSYFGEEFFAKARQHDSNANGLQIIGSDEVKKVALGVGVDLAFLEKSVEWGANFIIVHHGMNFDGLGQYLGPILQNRLKFIFDHNLTLMGFHYMLDAHPEIGNNAQTLKKLGTQIVASFSDSWGWVGEFTQAKSLEEVVSSLEEIFGREPIKVLEGKKEIKRVAVTSGGGVPRLPQMREFLDKEIDLYVTGEVRETTPALMQEAGINYLAFGHYDSEKFGVMALGDLLKKNFPGLEVEFIDIPNLF
ncbi:MAG: Nif3-like dinuclear metal center hexameric protein [Patescibacteria group bacterium]|jgi:dinuclear metal center YbgI/SA1388 family protein